MALTLAKLGGYAVYITGPDAIGQGVKVGGKVVCFDFDQRFGPLVVDRYGEPIDRQPTNENAAFWPPFEKWLAGYWHAKGQGRLEAYLTANNRTLPLKELRYPGRSHPAKRSAHSPSEASAGNPATDEPLSPLPDSEGEER